uniref:Uncharacterized protein n=1 Tax=Anguilla anguilla TaxID=7936 RepID=A0A0E9WF78_ANGAN
MHLELKHSPPLTAKCWECYFNNLFNIDRQIFYLFSIGLYLSYLFNLFELEACESYVLPGNILKHPGSHCSWAMGEPK